MVPECPYSGRGPDSEHPYRETPSGKMLEGSNQHDDFLSKRRTNITQDHVAGVLQQGWVARSQACVDFVEVPSCGPLRIS